MNVLITGTSSGIGKGCAKYFLKNGHKVYGFDRKESTIEHPDYKHYCLDIRDKEMYPELPPMQIVINNAGVQNEDDIDINLKGTIAFCTTSRCVGGRNISNLQYLNSMFYTSFLHRSLWFYLISTPAI